MSNDNIKTFDVHLPVWKKGSDLANYLDKNNDDIVKSFQDLALQYEEAANICRRISGVVLESKRIDDIDICADTHMISLSGPSEVFAGLVSDGILEEDTWEEENFEFEEEDLSEEKDDEDIN